MSEENSTKIQLKSTFSQFSNFFSKPKTSKEADIIYSIKRNPIVEDQRKNNN
jgi:hypothetical protein